MIHQTKLRLYTALVNRLWKELLEDNRDYTSVYTDIVYDSQGQIVKWHIVRTRLQLKGTRSFVQIGREKACLDTVRQSYVLPEYQYHYQPSEADQYAFRIENHHRDGLHANPDIRLEDRLPHHIPPDQLKLDIRGFSFLYFLITVSLYRAGLKYPLLPDTSDGYNLTIDMYRKQVESP
ncbi:MAG: hypothetical protein CW346_17210 [Bacillaceae bacterium]|nr:hypothetical protein [Bacillaceae bacterium]